MLCSATCQHCIIARLSAADTGAPKLRPGWPAQPGTAGRRPGQPAILQLSNANLLLGTGVTPNPNPLAADNILPANETAHCGGPFSGLWADHALSAIRTQSDMFFSAYHRASGGVDELVLDWEGQFLYFPGGFRAGTAKQAAPEPCPGPAGGAASQACLRCAAVKWRAIQADPRWPAAAAELDELGFTMKLGDDLAATMMAMACVGWDSGCARSPWHDRNRAAMGSFVTALEARFWQQAIEEPARVYFPRVRMSMYSFARWSTTHCLAPTDPDGWVACLAGNGPAALSLDAPELKDLTFPTVAAARNVPYAAPGVGAALEMYFGVEPADAAHSANGYWNASKALEAFLTIKLQLGMMKTVMLGSLPDGRLPGRFQERSTAPVVAPWVDWSECAIADGVRLPPTAFWQEKLLHLGLAGADHFYYYNVWAEHQGCDHTTMAANRLLSATLKELDLLVGCPASDRQWVTDTAVRWQDEFILTGMDVGADRRAWRLTPQLPRAAASWSDAGHTVHTDARTGLLTVSPLGFAVPNSTSSGTMHVAQCELRVLLATADPATLMAPHHVSSAPACFQQP